MFRKNKKGVGVVIPAFLGSILMIVGVVALSLFLMNTFGGGTKTGSLSVVQNAPAQATPSNGVTPDAISYPAAITYRSLAK